MPFWEQLGMQAAGQATSGILGLALGSINDRRQVRQQGRLGEQQLDFNKRMTDYQKEKELEMWKATSYAAQKEQMMKAGLNPGLLYGMSGGGGQTVGGGAAAVNAPNAPGGGGEAQAMIGLGIQGALLDAQRRNLDADTKVKEAEAANKPKQGQQIDATTEGIILENVIKKYAGKEAAAQFIIKQNNREIEAEAYSNEMSARNGIADVIYKLWHNGKLWEKSIEEIEGLVLGNAKTRDERKNIQKQFEILEQNLKGAKLDNVIKDLEVQLQQKTGLDKSSPGILKMIGRLLIGLGL